MIRLLLFGLLLTVQATAYATIQYVKPGGDRTRTGTYIPNLPANNFNTIDSTGRQVKYFLVVN